MKLRLRRDQQKSGLFGLGKGFDFVLHFKAEFTPEEKELINKYGVKDYILVKYKADGVEVSVRVEELEKGGSIYMKNVTELLDLEEKLVEACKFLKMLLEVMASFGGERVIEI